jgi:hypothetical protein
MTLPAIDPRGLTAASETYFAESFKKTPSEAMSAAIAAYLSASSPPLPADVERTGVWPDFIAPPKHENPHPSWTDPRLPDFRLIWKVARECGYSIGLHGSMKRDCDLIAVPWVDDAKPAAALIEALCAALNARQLGSIAQKPLGRIAVTLQVDGWVKPIDLSVFPASLIAAVAEEIRKLKEGLEPFAAIAEKIEGERPGWNHDDFVLTIAPDVPLLMAWLRRARQLTETPDA